MSEEARAFRARLVEESAAIRAYVLSDGAVDPRIYLSSILRCYDAENVKAEAGAPLPIPYWLSLLDFGLNPSLAQLLPAVQGLQGAPLFPMTPGARTLGLTLIAHNGRIAMAHRLLDLVAAGLMTATWRGDAVEFHAVDARAGIEALDRLEHDRLDTHSESEGEDRGYDEAQLTSELQANVRIWRDHFIAYESTPLIDEVYSKRAFDMMRKDSEFGSIQSKANFDDFTGSELLLVGAVLHSLHLKHAAFCIEYLRMFRDQQPEDVLTIWTTKDDLTESISMETGLAAVTVRACLEALALSWRNADHHLRRQTKSMAPLIEVADDIWLRPLTTGLSPVSEFAAVELSRTRTARWSSNVNLREAHFRTDLFGLFMDEKYLTLDGGRYIKADRRILTDVDAVLFDRESGTLALFQLKWQDVFGWDERERRSRAQNFTRECREWAETMRAYAADKTPAEIAQRLGVPGKAAKQAQRIALFVLGRHAARFSGFDLGDERDLAVATWSHFTRARLDALRSGGLGDDPISELHRRLQVERTERFHPTYLPISFEVAGMEIEANSWFFRPPEIRTPGDEGQASGS